MPGTARAVVTNVGEVETENNGFRKTEVYDATNGGPNETGNSFFDSIFDFFKNIKESIIDGVDNFGSWMKEGWEEFKGWLGPKWDGFTDWLSNFWDGVKEFFSQEWVQNVLKVIGAIIVVAAIILGGVYLLAAIGITLAVGTIIGAIAFGAIGVILAFASGETSFWGMVAGGLAGGLSFLGGLGVFRLLGAFRLIPASGFLRVLALGGLGGSGAVTFTLLHGALHYLFTGDSSLWKQAFTFESLFFNFTLGAVMGPLAARIFGKMGVSRLVSGQGNKFVIFLSRKLGRPVSQVANSLSRAWVAIKSVSLFGALNAGLTAILDSIIQWKETGKVDWKRTGQRAAVVFGTTLVIGLGTLAIPKLYSTGCACGDEIATSVSKKEQAPSANKQAASDLQNAKTVKNVTADEVNTWWKVEMGYDQPPYKPGTTVKEVQLTKQTTFVRVYDGENSKMHGGWMMRAEDIQGLTAREIQDKFALPYTPKYIADVTLNEGTIIRTGIVNPLFGHKGGGTQFDLKGQFVGEFGNERLIGADVGQVGIKDTGNPTSQVIKRSDPATYYTYDELRAMTKEFGITGRNVGFESHHLLSKQFASKFNVSQGDIISVPLTPMNHRGSGGEKIIGSGMNINNAIQKELKTIVGTKTERAAVKNATPEQIWQAHRNVYEKMGNRNWAEAIYDAHVKPLGIPYE